MFLFRTDFRDWPVIIRFYKSKIKLGTIQVYDQKIEYVEYFTFRNDQNFRVVI